MTGVHSEVAPGVDADALLRALVDVSGDALAVLDAGGRLTGLNAACADILGLPGDELLGRPAPFRPDPGPYPSGTRHTTWTGPGGRRRDLEYRCAPAPGGGHVAWFRDVTDARRQQQRLTAIARAASTVADAGSLGATLDAVAREISETANIAAVQILAVDDPAAELRVLGMAGFGTAPEPVTDSADFTARLSACRRLGARIRFLDAMAGGRTVVVPHRKPAIMADRAWEPLHAFMDIPDWDTFVSTPMVVRGHVVGVINAYYLPGEDPGPNSLAFLEAMADHAAVAIDTAALLAQTRSRAQLDERRRLARDLHDSVVQQLFSMRMLATALRAGLERPDADPAAVGADAQELVDLSRHALDDLRRLVFELRPLDLAERGLVDAVRAHADGLSARTGLDIALHAPVDLDPAWGVDVQEDLLRIIQEALHNVVKHARAEAVRIRLDPTGVGGGLVVEVSDDGSGPTGRDPAREAGDRQGLVSMRERAQRWGGRLDAGPRPDGGWTVRVALPARPAGRAAR